VIIIIIVVVFSTELEEDCLKPLYHSGRLSTLYFHWPINQPKSNLKRKAD